MERKSKPGILILGKLPPPYFGPAVATQIILNSSLKNQFQLFHVNNGMNKTVAEINEIKLKKVWQTLAIYIELIKSILKHRPSIVLVPISQSTVGFVKDSFFLIVSKLLNRKTIIHLRGSNLRNVFASSPKIVQWYARFMIKRMQGVIVLGSKLRDIFKDYLDDDRIFVVPNGANYAFSNTKIRNNGFRILYLSNLMSSKGIEDVLSAARILKNEYELTFQLDVVGEWCDETTKKECFKIFEGCHSCVRFHLPVHGSKKMSFFENADLFVFPPREPEGHPWVIIEAMAAGLPIISTDQGAITESVINGVNGFIVEKQNPQAIAEKIKYLIENEPLCRKMGKESRRLYLQNFTEEKMVERLAYVFKTVLANGRVA
jgi:glycosyltransferase involved in cell wall biosynthesis